MRSLRAATSVAGLAAAALLIAACGSTDAPVEEGSASDDATSVEPITVVDTAGTEITLPDGPAQRVVALEWAQAEIITSLGVELVGVSDLAGYTSWVGNAVPLLGEPADVGLRTEPSVEAIAELEPDLIIGGGRSVPEAVADQLEAIAPVMTVDVADASDPLGTLAERVDLIATTVGQQQAADDLLAQLDEKIAENAEAIEAADLSGVPVVLTSPYAEGANVTIRMHGPGTAVQAVADAMGLTAAWDDPGDEAYGLSYVDIEGLTALPEDTWFLYWDNDDSDDPVETSLAGNAIWDGLPFVVEGRVAPAANGIWAYGGPGSLMAWSDDLVQVLTAG